MQLYVIFIHLQRICCRGMSSRNCIMLFSFVCGEYAAARGGFRATVCCFHFDDTNVKDFKRGPRATVCCFHCLQDQRHSICISRLKIV